MIEKNPIKRYEKLIYKSIKVQEITHYKLKNQAFKEGKTVLRLLDELINNRIKNYKQIVKEQKRKK